MICRHCIHMKKCCEKFHADGACCGDGQPLTVKCPTHAVVAELATHLTRSKPKKKSEAA